MKTKVNSFFILFAITLSIITITPAAFADHLEVTIVPTADSKNVDCKDLDGCYSPNVATVDVGGVVIFSNTDSAAHTFTSGNVSDGPNEIFDSGFLAPGESYSLEITDSNVGKHDYFCMLHPWMLGTLVVQESEDDDMMKDDGGCLIATAAYGTELAPQVQLLREIRDNTLFSTSSGMTFMSGFNTLYYSFAPTIADWERESPAFKEIVKTVITPMLSTLSIMSLADEGSEVEVLGLGISVIVLNLAMYVGIPVFGILKLYQFRRN